MKQKKASSKFAASVMIVASVVLAASTPVSTVNAQSMLQAQASGSATFNGSLDQWKQRVETAIDKNIEKLQQSTKALDASFALNASKEGVSVNASGPSGSVSGEANKDGAKGSVETKNRSASGEASKNGSSGSINTPSGTAEYKIEIDSNGLFTSMLSIPKELMEKLKAVNEKAIAKLTTIKEKVKESTAIADVQAAAKEFDQNLKDFAVANVQANVTKAIDSMTKVLDRLQLVANNLQTQVSKIKQCASEGSANANANVGNGSASANVSVTAPGCADLNVEANSGDMAASLQEKLDQIKSDMQSVRSFLASSINLVAELNADFSGTLTSFEGISSQLDIVANLSLKVQNDLLNLSTSITK